MKKLLVALATIVAMSPTAAHAVTYVTPKWINDVQCPHSVVSGVNSSTYTWTSTDTGGSYTVIFDARTGYKFNSGTGYTVYDSRDKARAVVQKIWPRCF